MTHANASPKVYLVVFVALVVLAGLALVSRLPVAEPWHTLVGLSIALVKAALVVLFFMHLWYSKGLGWLVALSNFLWLGLLIGLTE